MADEGTPEPGKDEDVKSGDGGTEAQDAGKTDTPKAEEKAESEAESKQKSESESNPKSGSDSKPEPKSEGESGSASDEDEKAKKIAEAKKKAAAKKAAAKKEEPWPYAPKHRKPERTGDLDKLTERFGDQIVAVGDMSGKPVAYVAPGAARSVLQFAREELEFDHLPFVSGADYPDEDVLEVHWQLYAYPRGGRGGKDLAVKVHVPRDDSRVPSVVDLWMGAEWHEREAFDLLGIRFDGHRDLRRIFMPDDWRGHPLRKDYDRKEQYIGLSETGEDVVYDEPGPYRW